MTEQYLPKSINDNGYRRVNQTQIDATLATPAVVLGATDTFVLLDDDGVTGAYQVNMPRSAECPGQMYVLKNITGGVAVTVASARNDDDTANVDTFDGGAALAPALAATFSTILVADPPNFPVPPAEVGTAANNWSIIRLPAAP